MFIKKLTFKLIFFSYFFFVFLAHADFEVDPNNGFFTVDFKNTIAGLAPTGLPFYQNVDHDTSAGTLSYGGSTPSFFTTTEIEPNSFRNWEKIILDASVNNAADLNVDVVRCDGVFGGASPTVIASGLVPAAGEIDISSVVPDTEACIQVRVNLSDSDGIIPVVNQLTVTWDPLPVFLVRLDGDATKIVGEKINYSIDYSVSYVDSPGVVVWVPLPNAPADFSNYTAAYNQDTTPGFDLTFVSATFGGTYTAGGLTVNGVSVPANSVYWNMGDLNSGFAGTLDLILRSNNGLEDGISYGLTAYMDSNSGDEAVSDQNPGTPAIDPFVTTLTSAPSPGISKTVSGTINLPGKHIVFNGGSFTPDVTYTINFHDGGGNGKEALFNPVITDDLSGIYAKMMAAAPAGCGVATKAAVSALITPGAGGVLDETNEEIVWDFSNQHLLPGYSHSVTVTVDYSPCIGVIADGTTITNTAYGDSDKTTQVSDPETVVFGLDTNPYGNFAKGDRVRGSAGTSTGDDNSTALQSYGEYATYLMRFSNTGLVRVDDLVFMDMVPGGSEFSAARIASQYNATIYYTTDTGYTNPASPPPFSYTGARDTNNPGAIWSDTEPADPTTVTWVAWYVPCISSATFESPAGSECENMPASVNVEMDVRLYDYTEPEFIGTNGECSFFDVKNHGIININEASVVVTNADADVSALSSAWKIENEEPTHVAPYLADISVKSGTSISGPTITPAEGSANYTITVKNGGFDSAENLEVVISMPQLEVNGALEYLDLESLTASGASINYSGLPGEIVVTYPEIIPGSTKTISLKLYVPSGVFNDEEFTIGAEVSASDPESCLDFFVPISKKTKVTSFYFLDVKKFRNQTLINPYNGLPVTAGSDDVINYQLEFTNTGQSPTTQTYVVDRIPDKTIFYEAYTSPAVDSLFNTFNCTDCTVYFAKKTPDLPADLTAFDPIGVSDITNYFVEGVETSPGVWIPPVSYASPEQVYYIAWLVDNPNVTPPQFGNDSVGKVGYLVRNDDNGVDPGNVPSPEGTIVKNSAAIFSSELLQAIGNQVSTVILENPGLILTKDVEKRDVRIGEEFDWTLNYFNDGSSADVQAVLTDTLPLGLEIVAIENTWNSIAVANGAPAGGAGNILGHAGVTITPNADGTTTLEINISHQTDANLRTGDLRIQEGGSITVTTRVKSGLGITSGTELTNSVEGCYIGSGSPDESCISDEENVVVRKPDLWLRKLVSEEKPAAGETLTYTLALSNEGGVDAADVTIVDVLPAGLCYQANSTSVIGSAWSLAEPAITGGPCATAATTLTWTGITNPGNPEYPAYPPGGTLPGNSGDIYINYQVTVDSGVGFGVTLTNAAGVTTTDEEDPTFTNGEDIPVTTPLPDPYVVKSAPVSVFPGENISYSILYGNNSKQAINDVYLIDKLPDYDADGTVDITLSSVTGGNGESIYCHTSTTGQPAVSNLADPTLDGWSATCSSNTTYILIIAGTLAGYDGPHIVSVNASAYDPDVSANLSAGIKLVNNAHIYPDSAAEDEDPGNNNSSVTTKTPNADIYIEKTGSIEGAFPGTIPGTAITYSIEFGNTGTEPMCAVYIEDTLPAGVVAGTPLHNFTSLNLSDQDGNPVQPVDAVEAPIAGTVPVTYSLTGSTHRWDLGTDPANTCIPAGAKGVFEIYVEISSLVADSTSITNSITIGEDSPAEEEPEELINNTDDSTLTVYRADVLVNKEGVGCGADNDCSTVVAGDYVAVNAGDKIKYTIEYDNVGNTTAADVIIKERIPEGSCYRVNSIEANKPDGSVVEYSSNSGVTWTYSPVADGEGKDCNVTNFRIVFPEGLPAPATYWAQGSNTEFNTNTLNGDLTILSDTMTLQSSGVRNLTTNAEADPDINFTDGGNTYTQGHEFALDSNGQSHVIWGEYNSALGRTELLYYDAGNYRDLSTEAFDAGVGTSDGTVYYYNTLQLQIGSDNNPHIAWNQIVGGSSYDTIYYDGTNFINLTDGAEAAGIGFSDSGQANLYDLKLDSNNKAHIVWSEYDSGNRNLLYYNGATNTYYNLSEGVDTAFAGFTSNSGLQFYLLEIDSADNAHIIWWEQNTQISNRYDILYFTNGNYYDLSEGAEAALATFTNNNNAYWSVGSAALDSSNKMHIIWRDYNNVSPKNYDIFYFDGDSTYVHLSEEAAAAGIGFTNSNAGTVVGIQVDSSDKPHIVWYENSDVIYYDGTGYINLSNSAAAAGIKFTNGGWGSTNYQFFKLDSAGSPHIVWYEYNSDSTAGRPAMDNILYFDGSVYRNLTEEGVAAGELPDSSTYYYINSFYKMLLDSSDNIHFLYSEYDYYNPLLSYYYDGSSFTELNGSAETAIGDFSQSSGYGYGGYGGFRFFELSAADNPHILWLEGNGQSDNDDQALLYHDGTNYQMLSSLNQTANGVTATLDGETLHAAFFETPYYGYYYTPTPMPSPSGSYYYYQPGDYFYWNNTSGTEQVVGPETNSNIYYYDYPFTNIGVDSTGKAHFAISNNNDEFLFPGDVGLGNALTLDIVPDCGSGNFLGWGKLLYNYNLAGDSVMSFDVLDTSDNVIASFDDIFDASGFIDVSSLDTGAYPQVKLRVNMTPDSEGNVPTLNTWALTYTCDQLPSFNFEVQVKEGSDLNVSTIDNTVVISTTTPESDTTNNSGSDSLNVKIAELNIDKSVDKAAAVRGDALVYTLNYCNDGPSIAKNVVITDTLPVQAPSTLLVSHTGNDAGCTESSGVLTCNIGDVAVGECGSVTINATINASAPPANNAVLTNEACIASDTHDTDSTDDCNTAKTTIANIPNLYVQKTGPVSASLGSLMEYTLSYGNNGNSLASGVILKDTFADSTQLDGSYTAVFNYVSGPISSCSESAGIVTCAATDIAAGASGEIKVTVKASSSNTAMLVNSETIDNTACMEYSSPQSDISDDCDAAEVPVVSAGLSDISGKAFVDKDGDNEFDSGSDSVIAGASIYLYGYDIFGNVLGPDPSSPLFNTLMSEIISDIQNDIDPGLNMGNLASYAKYQILVPDVTDSAGDYSFSGLQIGYYNLYQSQPLGYKSVGSNSGQLYAPRNPNDDSVTSGSANPGHGIGTKEGGSDNDYIRSIYLAEQQLSTFNDFAESLGSISGTLFSDANQNGIYESGTENYIESVEVTLYQDVNGDGLLDAGDIKLASVLTDSNGNYTFNDLSLDDGDGDFEYLVVVTDSTNALSGSTNILGPDQSQDPASDNNSKDADGFPVVLDTAATSTNVADFGFVSLSSLGDYVWNDENGNGIQDAGETGISGIAVRLYSASNLTTSIASTVTDGSGYYEFTDIEPGDYVVEVVPGSFTISTKDSTATTDTFDSDVDTISGRTDSFTLLADTFDRSIDIGLQSVTELASVGDLVWNDANNNGIQDSGEEGIGGVQVKLLNSSGTEIASATTNADGSYEFTGLLPGDYKIEIAVPAGFAYVSQDAGADDAVDSDLNTTTGQSDLFTLAAGDNKVDLDAGFYAAAGTSSIGDFIWLDTNNNGIQDSGETGVPGIILELYDSSDNFLQDTVSDASGAYEFSSLLAGSYYVKLILPSGSSYSMTLPNVGSDDAVDSDIDNLTFLSPTITLVAGVPVTNLDAGLTLPTAPSSIGDFIWEDTDANGEQNEIGTGIQNVEVILLDSNGIEITSVLSDASGNYTFNNLSDGSYYVQVIKPAGLLPTFKGATATSATDSNMNVYTGTSDLIVLPAATDNDTIDAGFITPGSISGTIVEDLDQDGILDVGENSLKDIQVTLYDDVNGDGLLDAGDVILQQVFTDANGDYTFSGLALDDGDGDEEYIVVVTDSNNLLTEATHTLGADQSATTASDNNAKDPDTFSVTLSRTLRDLAVADFAYYFPASIGDYVWEDSNSDGVQDAGESGISGITVNIYTSSDLITPADTTVTDGSGYYEFTGLEPGDYVIEVVPASFTITTQDVAAAGDAFDSDIDTGTGRTGIITLTSSEVNSSVDAGLISATELSSIGDYIWNDANNNGIQDSGEVGVGGVTVKLLNSTGTEVSSTTTLADGSFEFLGVVPGDYRIEIIVPTGFSIVSQDAGSDDSVDSDLNPTTSQSDLFTTIAGEVTDIDGGLYAAAGTASLGNFVWLDTNNNGVQDSGETGVPGITVELYDSGDNFLLDTLTDGAGVYGFNSLLPGDYYVKAIIPFGSSYTIVSAKAGEDDTKDSDVNTATGISNILSLIAGSTNSDLDIGLYLASVSSIGDYVWEDTDRDGTQNESGTGIQGVTVTLFDSSGNMITSTETDSSGAYSFNNLNAGDYYVHFASPAGYLPTTKGSGSTANVATGRTDLITLAAGANDNTIDAGFVSLGSIGGTLFSDANQNGIYEPGSGEGIIPSVEITLYRDVNNDGVLDPGDTVVATQFTDPSGNFLFENLLLDDGDGDFEYLVVVTDSTNVINGAANILGPDQSATAGSDNNSKNAEGFAVTLGNSLTDLNVADFGFYGQSSVGDFVWNDVNNNGVQDAGETGISGVTVNLYASTDLVTPVATTTTDGSGYYEFKDIDPGDYVIEVIPGSFSITTKDSSLAGDAFDSDVDTVSGRTDVFSLTPADFDKTWDIGLQSAVELASIGDYIWNDANNNGIQDSGEVGVGGVTVKLLDSSGTEVASTTTNADGSYEFVGVIPGDYRIEVVAPTGFTLVGKDAGSDDAVDSDVDTGTGQSDLFTLVAGGTADVDAGLYAAAGTSSIGDYVWLDTNGDGIQDTGESGVLGITVELYDSSNNFLQDTITDSSGAFEFNSLLAGDYYIKAILPSGSTYEISPKDQGGDDALDSDVDPTTLISSSVTLVAGTPIDNLDVGLTLSVSPSSIGDYVWEDSNGDGTQNESGTGITNVEVFLLDRFGGTLGSTFTNSSGYYNFNNLSAGDYYVRFSTPAGYVATIQGTGTATDSDINQFSGTTDKITLATASDNLDIDAGYVLPASISGNVWNDDNFDGVLSAGEVPEGSVLVTLYDSGGTVITSVSTDSAGNYTFGNLSPGTYTIGIMPPSGKVLADKDVGADDTIDSDFSTGTNRTDPIIISSGEDKKDIDAGLTLILASVGNLVWEDANKNGLYETSEAVMPGVTVNLFEASVAPAAALVLVESQLTDVNGNYLFTDLIPGKLYYIQVQLPTGYEFTIANAGADDTTDSDVDPLTGETASFTLSSGENNLDYDAGLFKTNTGIIPTPNPGCNGNPDFDGDGIANGADVDADNDGIQDIVEGLDDFDGDGLANYIDADSDGDGLTDFVEAQATGTLIYPSGNDVNANGLDDAFEPAGVVPVDTDFDGMPDYLDKDSDNDGIDDMYEIQDPNYFIPPAGSDSDCDGLDDTCEPPLSGTPQCGPYDGDPNNIPDFRETPLECSDENLLPLQFGMDGTGAQLMDQVRVTVSVRRKLARKAQCEDLSRKAMKAILGKASDYYLKIWEKTWTIPAESYPCQISAPRSPCVVHDVSEQVENNIKYSKKLYRLIKRTLKRCDSVPKVIKLRKYAKKLKEDIEDYANRVPDPVTNCK